MTTSTPTHPIYYPTKLPRSDYALIDNDPHLFRVVRYARPRDYFEFAAVAAFGPGSLMAMEWLQPTHVTRQTWKTGFRLATTMGVVAGFLTAYKRVCMRFYGFAENAREVDMDMREMVDKVKAGQPLYGESRLTPRMQAVAARQSRYSAMLIDLLPWFNFVNHNQHGVDTAKYYQQAERELEAERLAGPGLGDGATEKA